ncbi:hypothetical protein A2Z67_04590 [Candidatus Woesebacteria bacterium RBG_13_36_22]|uniref:Succinylglutamate desuccinylase/Aspartoacylase catalytic domain-containing protein n=1 Tax=Candidatus Woesebacteria bacterium RBG_13_36_22 TaxID=1802478 RepID=A0A1F7X276_9BACT|nr:MAG: hypothetical protein A2Z67_04590 [Candidatus Woesebacteria bacterium RBG_13_36_22]
MAAIRKFMQDIFSISAQKRFFLCALGEVDGRQIWLVRSRSNAEHSDPKMLVVAGFHGEEKAGPYAILKWMKNCDQQTLRKVDLSFIPIVNPIGFAKNMRYAIPGEKTNCGFCHPERGEVASREGKILITNIDLLKPLAEDGFLSLHEDIRENAFYLYTFEKSKKPGAFTTGIREELGKHFRKALDGVHVEIDASDGSATGPIVKDGVVFRHCDGSFEDWMFHLGVPRAVVTETPGLYRLKRRIDAGASVIDKFIALNLELGRKPE